MYCLSAAYCPRCRRYTPHGLENESFTRLVRQCVTCGLVASDEIPKKTGVDTGWDSSKLDGHADNVGTETREKQ